MLRIGFLRACARQAGHGLGLATIALLSCGLVSSQASAALIGSYSLRFDGHVKSGANTGVEGHYNANIPYINPVFPPHELPANIDPPAPLPNAIDLRVTETEAANHIIISINSANTTSPIFASPLDPAYMVEWEAAFAWTNVGALEKIVINDVDFENFSSLPFPAPTSQTITGSGTVADPLKVSLQLSPTLFSGQPNNISGPVKVHLYYERGVIPEPTAAVLGLLALTGAAGGWRRRSR